MQYEVFGIFTHQMGQINALWGEPFATQRDRRYARMLRLAQTAMQSDLPLIVEGTYERTAERDALAALARANEYSVVFIYVYTSDSPVVLARFNHRAQSLNGPDHRASDPAIYFDSLKRFERVGKNEAHSYDAYAEIDSATKRLTYSTGSDKTLLDIVHAFGFAYSEIDW